ncbi:hypothetical protein Ndes2526B_g00661 [Nannochloris sp. 'desiccata']|nr:hypothetical protein KSW81_003957 [Chlorella desiccata (nom. nud.)]KAH7624461.1 putative Ferritin-3, chloroplastic [Chlorella desiccata (nom. nud.)]
MAAAVARFASPTLGLQQKQGNAQLAHPSHRRCQLTSIVPRATSTELTGVVFQPFDAVQSELAVVDKAPVSASYARVDFHPECEAAINEQINIEYNVSYVYHSLYAYFSRDNVALPGIAAFFKKESAEERQHAELLMDFQTLRGGHVALKSIISPETEFSHPEKGDALYAFELALSLEKLNFQKLRHLHTIADKHGDAQMADFIEGDLLADQANSVKESAEKVAQLRRVGKGLGVFEFDRQLQA